MGNMLMVGVSFYVSQRTGTIDLHNSRDAL